MNIGPGNVAVLLMAAGRSERYGKNKLNEDYAGKPLGLHAASLFAKIAFGWRFVVTAPGGPDFASLGYTEIPTDNPQNLLSDNIRLGLAAILETSAKAILVAHADMPRIRSEHVFQLLRGYDGHIVLTEQSRRSLPPVLVGLREFRRLAALEGDAGAHEIDIPLIRLTAHADSVIDIDTPEDMALLRTMPPVADDFLWY